MQCLEVKQQPQHDEMNVQREMRAKRFQFKCRVQINKRKLNSLDISCWHCWHTEMWKMWNLLEERDNFIWWWSILQNCLVCGRSLTQLYSLPSLSFWRVCEMVWPHSFAYSHCGRVHIWVKLKKKRNDTTWLLVVKKQYKLGAFTL